MWIQKGFWPVGVVFFDVVICKAPTTLKNSIVAHIFFLSHLSHPPQNFVMLLIETLSVSQDSVAQTGLAQEEGMKFLASETDCMGKGSTCSFHCLSSTVWWPVSKVCSLIHPFFGGMGDTCYDALVSPSGSKCIPFLAPIYTQKIQRLFWIRACR